MTSRFAKGSLPILLMMPGLSACDQQVASQSSITVELPPARQSVAKPGFNFEASPDHKDPALAG